VISDKADNRNIISLEDLKEEAEEKSEEKKEEKKLEKSPYLSDEEIKEYLERYRGRVPSVILRDIYEMLKGRRITERHIDRIVEKVESMLNADNQLRKIDDIYRKLESLEKLLRQDVSRVSDLARMEASSEEKEEEKKMAGEESDEIGGEVEIEVEGVPGEYEFKVENKRSGASGGEDRGMAGVAGKTSERLERLGGDVMTQEYVGTSEFRAHAHPEARKTHEKYQEVYREAYPRYPARRDRPDLEYVSGYGLFDTEPRLSRIPTDAKRIMLLLKWIEFLMERVGYDGLEDVLNYYVDINWISEDVLMAVLRYAKGIKLYHDNSDWRPVGYMNVQDHLMSLLYIEALRTGRFDRNLIMEVEKDLYRMKKEVAELHGV